MSRRLTLSAYKIQRFTLAGGFFFIIVAFYRQFYELTKVVLPDETRPDQARACPDNT